MIWSPRLQPVEDFDVGGAGDAGLHFAELGLAGVDHEDALQLFLARFLGGGIGLGGGLASPEYSGFGSRSPFWRMVSA